MSSLLSSITTNKNLNDQSHSIAHKQSSATKVTFHSLFLHHCLRSLCSLKSAGASLLSSVSIFRFSVPKDCLFIPMYAFIFQGSRLQCSLYVSRYQVPETSPVSNVHGQLPSIQCPVSMQNPGRYRVHCPLPRIQYPVSSVHCPASRIKCPVSNV